MMSVPNVITILRTLLIPLIWWLILERRYAGALGAFLAAGLGDLLDGFIARRLKQVSRFGALLDPAADKLTVFAAVVALAWQGLFPVWLAAAIVGRDLVITLGAAAYHLALGRVEMTPSPLSKLNTFLEFAVISAALAHAAGVPAIGARLPELYVLVLVTVVLSGGQYVWVWGRRALESSRSGSGSDH
jgi:cardiolipin synthase